jgi:hypothetical protein
MKRLFVISLTLIFYVSAFAESQSGYTVRRIERKGIKPEIYVEYVVLFGDDEVAIKFNDESKKSAEIVFNDKMKEYEPKSDSCNLEENHEEVVNVFIIPGMISIMMNHVYLDGCGTLSIDDYPVNYIKTGNRFVKIGLDRVINFDQDCEKRIKEIAYNQGLMHYEQTSKMTYFPSCGEHWSLYDLYNASITERGLVYPTGRYNGNILNIVGLTIPFNVFYDCIDESSALKRYLRNLE